jgi:hypothetical protein
MVRFDSFGQAMERQRGAKSNARIIRRQIQTQFVHVHACQYGLTLWGCQPKLTHGIATAEWRDDGVNGALLD